MYATIGKLVVRYGLLYVRRRYRRQLRIGAALAAAALAIGAYAATRNVPEG